MNIQYVNLVNLLFLFNFCLYQENFVFNDIHIPDSIFLGPYSVYWGMWDLLDMVDMISLMDYPRLT